MNIERQARLPQSLLLLLGSCLPVLGAVLLAPILPRMQEHFADTPGVAVLVPIALTLPALMIALLAPVAGIIADRLGRKPLLIGAMLLYTVCGVLPLWLESLEVIVISRAGIGVAEAAIMTCCTTMMGDYYSGARRERMFALQMVATSLSAAIFIAVGGVLGEQGWRTPFALYGLGLVFLPLMAWLLWEPRAQVVTATTVNRAFPWRALAPLYALAFLAGLSLFIVPVQVGYLLNLLHVEGSQQIGLTMGASQLGVLVGALSFRLFSGVPAYRQMLLALVAAGIGGGLLAVADSHGLVVIAVLINGLGIGLMMPTLLTWIMSQVDFQQRGRAAGGFTSMFFAGEFASPVVVLAITGGAISALPAALGIVAGVQLVVALACLRLRGGGSAFPTAVAADSER
ncbi:MFS transporter [Pseudomonas syringae]|uniref:MFS transporter n=1 Tax=Pseudomonas syringae TaxID=317 RepID=UPI001BCDC453|nr:MFS transporter [Pseudomonas syringae]MBS7425935.1 MFS transporter [Pseudomonas syringae]MBS7431948.1 MFS transporter [Pseudomonas syringae]MBS7463133.1 MFS transporter [Pseudomonas syringae]MBS7472508.1 MFS transporter [Pseudomonas syringae]QVI82917.1 MFS transporter [Pseudomonas syringae]